MGLDLSVGAYGVFAGDGEALAWLNSIFSETNVYLQLAGLGVHREPTRASGLFNRRPVQSLSYEMYSYSGIHYLRRFAAFLREGLSPTPASSDEPEKDEVVTRYYEECDWEVGERVEGDHAIRFFTSGTDRPNFDHLVFHNDESGVYVPIDFGPVLFTWQAPDRFGFIGSSQTLMRECDALAQALQLPLSLDPESDDVWDATDGDEDSPVPWKRFGRESFTCLRLYHACKASIDWRSAILFH